MENSSIKVFLLSLLSFICSVLLIADSNQCSCIYLFDRLFITIASYHPSVCPVKISISFVIFEVVSSTTVPLLYTCLPGSTVRLSHDFMEYHTLISLPYQSCGSNRHVGIRTRCISSWDKCPIIVFILCIYICSRCCNRGKSRFH